MFIDKIDKKWMPRCALLPKYPEEYFTNLLNKLKPEVVLEIGTWTGVTAAFLASFPFVKKVYTIDNQRLTNGKLWGGMELSKKIQYIVVKDNNEKKDKVKDINFDFVFIDGDHSYEGVKLDFEMVKDKCKHILFHDYGTNPQVTKFIDGLSGITQKRSDMSFAKWEKK